LTLAAIRINLVQMATPPVFQSPYPRPDLEQASGPVCPACGCRATKKVKYTWWGGVVGPGLFNLMKCDACRCQFNAKTGKTALKAIIVYNVVVFGVAFAILFLFMQR
jgi:hypothetical protein